MSEFTSLMTDLSNNINSNIEFFKTTLIKKNPTMAYYKLNELSNFVGSRYNLKLEIHFPNSNKVYDIDNYGKENISIIIDKFRKTFTIQRERIKQEAENLFKNIKKYKMFVKRNLYSSSHQIEYNRFCK